MAGRRRSARRVDIPTVVLAVIVLGLASQLPAGAVVLGVVAVFVLLGWSSLRGSRRKGRRRIRR